MTVPDTVRAHAIAPRPRPRPRRNRLVIALRDLPTMISVTLLTVLVLLAVAAPWLFPDANTIAVIDRLRPPSFDNPLGTDDLGRDILGRLAHAAQLTLLISLGAASLSIALGIVWGMVSAVFRSWADEVLMRVADAIMAIPIVLFGLVFVAAFGTSVWSLIIVLGILQSPLSARVFRAATMSELSTDYVRGVVAVGVPRSRIIFSELLPNIVPTVIAQAVLNIASAVLIEATLSFVGLGIQPPQASWGSLLKSGYDVLFQAPWYSLAPAIAIVALLASLNVLGQRIQKSWGVRTS